MVSPTVMAASSDAVAKTVDVQFKKGASSANYYGKLKGSKYDSYTFYAKKNQKLSVKTTDASQSTSESCFSKGKNLGSFGVNWLKKEFFISVKTLNCFFFSIYISNK